jgi:hypothetical protein
VPPDPFLFDLHNRLARAEAGLRSVEKALEALFKRVNVNRKRDPELDAVLEALASILHGLEKTRGDRSNELRPEPECPGISMSVEDVTPENDPQGGPEAWRLYTQDGDGAEKVLRAVIPTKLPEN